MASFFNLILDTTAPTGCSIALPTLSATRSITATLAATGATQMLLYGDIGAGSSPTSEAAATWETYDTSKAVQLTSGDGSKTVKAKFRDAVGNVSAEVTANCTLDTTSVIVTITGPDVSTISKVAGNNVCSFSFSGDGVFEEYKVKVVPNSGSLHSAGVLIPTTGGSTNMSGAEGGYPATTPINCTINAADLETASAGDGAKIVKVFVKDAAGNWSV